MILYVNVYPAIPQGREEPVTRVFTDFDRAAYQRYEDCLGTYMINTDTKEAREIPPL